MSLTQSLLPVLGSLIVFTALQIALNDLKYCITRALHNILTHCLGKGMEENSDLNVTFTLLFNSMGLR